MFRSIAILLSVIALLVLSQACVPGVSPPNADSVNTAIAQTIVAGLTQTATSLVLPPALEATASPVFTSTPDLATATVTQTPTATLSPTPVFTTTLAVPQVSVSVATNCRVGPGRVYDRVSALLVGEVAEVAGRNPDGNYWLIRTPRGDGVCWLWGEYATLTGNLSVLPVYTPPPSPTPRPTSTPVPDFAAFYDGKDTCSGWWVDIELDNTGGVTFRSMSLTVLDTVNNTLLALTADSFTNRDGCNVSETRDSLPPDAARNVSSPAFGYDPTGHRLRATITLCSDLGLNGICRTQVIQFTP